MKLIAYAQCLFSAVSLQELPSLEQQIVESCETAALLEGSHARLTDEAVDLFWQLRNWPVLLEEQVAAAKDHLLLARDEHKHQLKRDQAQLQADIDQVQVSRPLLGRSSGARARLEQGWGNGGDTSKDKAFILHWCKAYSSGLC
jgi:hypothetical protein